jgi:5-methylcytosine-specific restriction endonuclease McrA
VHATSTKPAKSHSGGGPKRPSHDAAAQAEAGPSHPSHTSPLEASVLVLNRLYLAVRIVNVRRAFGLLCREMAEVIHLEEGRFANYTFDSWREISLLRVEERQPHDDWIRAVNFEIQVPRVIRLLAFDRIPKQKLHLSRRNILARDSHTCQYCGRHFPTQQLSLDHVIPKSRGGMTSWENVVCACLTCNVRKGGRTPHEAKMKLVRSPVKPQSNPMLALKLRNPKYESWRTWLEGVYWEIGAKD